MYIDTHCHLTFPEFHADRAMVIGNAKKAGVKKFIVPGVDPLSSKQAVELTEKNPGIIFSAVGFHPYEAQHNPDVCELEKLLRSHPSPVTHPPSPPAIVALGECGLDYHQYKGVSAQGKKDRQKFLFEDHLRLALRFSLPVIIHCRDAWEDIFPVLDSMPAMPRGVLHCFSGGLQEVRIARERNLFIGIDGNVTYSKHLESIVPHIPLESLLLETDSPYLTPIPHRGTRNEPKYLPLIAKKIADLTGKTVKEIEAATAKNAEKLFQLSS
jgi:TatD DNase family protein